MSKFVSDEWMISRNLPFEIKEENNSQDPDYYSLPISKLVSTSELKTINENQKVKEVLKIMKDNRLEQIPIICPNHKNLIGMFTAQQTMKSILNKKIKFDDDVSKCLVNDFPRLTSDESIGKLCKLLNRYSCVAIVNRKENLDFITNILSPVDILNYLNK